MWFMFLLKTSPIKFTSEFHAKVSIPFLKMRVNVLISNTFFSYPQKECPLVDSEMPGIPKHTISVIFFLHRHSALTEASLSQVWLSLGSPYHDVSPARLELF